MSKNKALDSKNSGRKPSNVVDQFFAAQLSQNESEATIRALRPQVEQAVIKATPASTLPTN